MSVLSTLIKVQSELKAPKDQTNKFGNYKYRSCEDILEAVKPINAKYGASVLLSDEIVTIGTSMVKDADGNITEHTKNYIKTIARFITEEGELQVSAYAREAEDKKGMDDSQITGATSSYARKYALNGLYDIDDTKDADATNDHGKSGQTTVPDKMAKHNPTLAEISKKLDEKYQDTNETVFTSKVETPKPDDGVPFAEGDNRISKVKLDYITGIVRSFSVDRVMKFNEWLEKTYKCRSVNELTDSQATSVIAQLTKKQG